MCERERRVECDDDVGSGRTVRDWRQRFHDDNTLDALGCIACLPRRMIRGA